MLEKLNEIQQVDLKLDAFDEEKGRVPPELIETRTEKEELETRLAARRAERDAVRSEVRASELEIQTLTASRKKSSEGALRASSAKEASQFQNQELQFATRLQEVEEDALPLMEQQERLEATVAGLEAELAEIEPVLAERIAAEEERLADIDRRSADLRAQREALVANVDRGLLKQYEQVRKARRGVGLVQIVEGQTCGGCNVRLPIHVIQKAHRGGKMVTRCPSCGRILWPRETAS